MNIIYETREYLPILKKNELLRIDLSGFFSTHKNSNIYITDEIGALIGYINHMHYKKNLGKRKFYPLPIESSVEKEDLPYVNLQKLFSDHPSCESIPVMSNGILIGAFIKNYPEELTAYDRLMNKIALNALHYFKNELRTFLREKSISDISFIGTEEDRMFLEETLKESTIVLPQGDLSGKLTIDTIHSKSYRERLINDITRIYSLEELVTILLIPIVKNYCKERGVKLHIYEGPLLEKLNSPALHGLMKRNTCTLEDAIEDNLICKQFSAGNNILHSFLKDAGNGPLRDNYVITNGLHLLMGIANRGREVSSDCSIHLYGSCLTYGMCVPEELSICAIMKHKLRAMGYEVINHGVKNGHSLLNDLLYLLNTPMKSNDHAVIINAYSSKVSVCLRANLRVTELSDVLNKYNDSQWYFLDNTFHVNHIANHLIAHSICESIENIKATPVQNHKAYSYMEIIRKTSHKIPDNHCDEWILGAYKEYLLAHKRISENIRIGSVLLTANPITKGHEYLIKHAKSHCDILYLFLVEEDLFFFSTSERMILAHEAITDPNIIIVSTGSMMTAKFTFPEYFSKSLKQKKLSKDNISDFHFEIFGRFVCPLLGITTRFVGEEKDDQITRAYNQKLQTTLPKYGVNVVEIPRLETKDLTAISSSSVRKAIENGDYENLSALVSEPVERYIRAKWKGRN